MTLSADLTAAAQAASALEKQVASLKAQVADLQAQLAGTQPAPTPTPTPTSPTPTMWGISGNSWDVLANGARALDAAKATGAKIVRVDFDWGQIESTKGTRNWARWDSFVSGCNSRGLKVLATLAFTPAWARPSGTSDKAPPTNLADFTAFCQAAVTRYAPQGVHWWEIWNEQNIPMFWQPKPDPVKYTTMLKQAYAAIKAVDPSAIVMNGGFSPAGDSSDGLYVSPRTFLTKMYANGAKGSFNAFAIHPYAFNYGIDAAGDWNQWYSLPKTRQILVDNGDSALKVWATEYGAPTGSNMTRCVTETQQAQYVQAAWTEWTGQFGAWTGPLLWYCLRDTGTDKTDEGQNFGLYRNDWSAKPAVGVFQKVTA